MTFYDRNIVILLVLVVDLFQKSCKLRSARRLIRPRIPVVTLNRPSQFEIGLRGERSAVTGKGRGSRVQAVCSTHRSAVGCKSFSSYPHYSVAKTFVCATLKLCLQVVYLHSHFREKTGGFMKQLRCVFYVRVSTNNGQQNPEVQLNDMRPFAESRAWSLVGEYIDHCTGSKNRARN